MEKTLRTSARTEFCRIVYWLIVEISFNQRAYVRYARV